MGDRQQFVQAARGELGRPYSAHRDCSGFTAWCGRQANLILPEGSVAQYKVGTAVIGYQFQRGDLLFWDTFGEAPGHVAIYESDGQVIHALNPSAGIIRSRWDAEMGGPYMGARRLIFKDEVNQPVKNGKGGTSLKFGTLKAPPHEVKIVVKPWDGAGFDRVAPRDNVGLCMHKWWGFGDKYALYRLFSSGGERQADALTDWSLTQEGELVMLNEPWKTRAGWANGPADDLEGDGTLFVRKLGIAAVNGRLVSVEFEGKDEILTAAQMEVGSSLWAYYYDAWKVSWEDYPMNPKVGCVTDLDHWEIGSKECPFAGARSQRHDFQALVKGKLKAAQVGGDPDPIDPDPKPDHDWLPEGLTIEVMEGLFGTGIREDVDGSKKEFTFDEKGLISNAWINQSAKLKVWPEARHWWRIADEEREKVVRNIVSFSNGWVLMGDDGARSSWQWR